MNLNKNQKILLIVCATIIALMLLFPPFHIVAKNGQIFAAGYHWLFDGPLDVPGSIVSVETLVVQWFGVLLIGGIIFFVLKGKGE